MNKVNKVIQTHEYVQVLLIILMNYLIFVNHIQLTVFMNRLVSASWGLASPKSRVYDLSEFIVRDWLKLRKIA